MRTSKPKSQNAPDYGCQSFKVMLPRKAVNMIKQKHKNVGAFIRGLIADELGADWPASDLKIHNPAKPGHREILKVIRPSRHSDEQQAAETEQLPGLPAKQRRPKLARHRKVNSVSKSLQTQLRREAMQRAAERKPHSDAEGDPFKDVDLEKIAREAFAELHQKMDSEIRS